MAASKPDEDPKFDNPDDDGYGMGPGSTRFQTTTTTTTTKTVYKVERTGTEVRSLIWCSFMKLLSRKWCLENYSVRPKLAEISYKQCTLHGILAVSAFFAKHFFLC